MASAEESTLHKGLEKEGRIDIAKDTVRHGWSRRRSGAELVA